MHCTILGPSRALIAVAALTCIAACAGNDAQASGAQPRSIELAPAPAQPTPVNDVARPVSRTTTAASPAPIERTSGGRTGTISAGTAFAVHAVPNVCTNTHHVGDVFTASLLETVQGSNGVSVPAGSAMKLRVVESKRSEDSKNRAKLSFTPVSVTISGASYAFDGRVTQVPNFNMERAQSTQVQAEKVAAGAAIGAIAGQVLGKNTRSTVIGGVIGTAGGAVVAAGTADYDACVPNTGSIQITLDRELRVRG
jgi:hypothetical protein